MPRNLNKSTVCRREIFFGISKLSLVLTSRYHAKLVIKTDVKSYNVIFIFVFFWIGKSLQDLPVEYRKLITEYSVSLASKNERKREVAQ